MKATQLIANNPYRVLGVYVGASPAEESRNSNRIRAFANVGQSVDFPMNGDDMLPPAERNSESVARAVAALSLPSDRIQNALIWFGDGKSDWSIELNSAVTALLNGDIYESAVHYDHLLTDMRLRFDFLNAASRGLKLLTEERLCEMISDIIFCDEDITATNTDIITSAPVGPLTKRLAEKQLIAEAHSLNKELEHNYNYITDPDILLNKIKLALNRLLPLMQKAREIFGSESPQYAEMSEKAAKQLYMAGANVIRQTGTLIWNNNAKNRSKNGYIRYRTALPPNSVKAGLELMRDCRDSIVAGIDALALKNTSKAILSECTAIFEKILHDEYMTDAAQLRKAKRSYLLERCTKAAIWLGIMTFIYLKI